MIPSLVIVALAGAAWAQEQEPDPSVVEQFSGTDDLRIRYYRSPDQLPDFEDRRILDYVEAVNRLNLAGGTDKVTLTLQGDAVALFANRYILDGELYHERQLYLDGVHSPFPDALFTLEKAQVRVQGKAGSVEVGDSYASFGRGIALNLVKNTELDIDTSLRGAKGLLRAGPWDVVLFSGVTNPRQVAMEEVNVGLPPDVLHAVTGLRVDRFGLGPVNLGAHGVAFQFSRGYYAGQDVVDAWTQPLDAVTAGGNVEAMGIGGIDVYAEGDAFVYRAEEIPVDSGWEAYLSAAAYPGRASVLFEAKRQKNTEYLNTFAALNKYEMAAGPTLEYERVITEDSSAAVNSNDLFGGRLKVDLPIAMKAHDPAALPPTLVPTVSVAVFRDLELGGLHFNETPETIVHGLGSVLFIEEETHLQLNAGYRRDQRDQSPTLGDLGADEVIHADLALAIPIAGPVSVEIAPAVLRYHWGVNPAQQQEDFTEFANALALKIGPPWALILYTDYSDNEIISSVGNVSENVYAAGEVQWKPTTATTLKVFYGAYRAGIRCAGGQCRSLPGFDGGRISFTTAF